MVARDVVLQLKSAPARVSPGRSCQVSYALGIRTLGKFNVVRVLGISKHEIVSVSFFRMLS